jgi:hypothetical protein
MSSLFDSLYDTTKRPRYSEVDAQKSSGATYTPPDLAAFVADQMVAVAQLRTEGKIRVLDPAVGDGALLDALVMRLPPQVHERLHVVGYDTSEQAVKAASARLNARFPTVDIRLRTTDFLTHVLEKHGAPDLLTESALESKFDLVIANPPYVRTQVMGAKQAQELSESFGLSGRVDLYYPFVLGISRVLAADGVAAVITSNRFMTTKSGQSIRRALLSNFEVLHAWDLGDTKLFEAAVLPAVLLARGTAKPQVPHTSGVAFTSIYQTAEPATESAVNPLAALSSAESAVVQVADGRRFHVKHGSLDNGSDAEGVWRIGTRATDEWLAMVQSHTWATFRRIGKIRVGVKSTADKVFIRSDWDSLPEGRPELLRPLITRYCARRFKACLPSSARHVKEILYPHEPTSTGRRPVDLGLYPRAQQYLEQHRATLEARTYVIEAGRKWYELWVPQDPSAWPSPKLVFPDISDQPIFWIDTGGGVVNGECYWLQCENSGEEDLLWLALAVANSKFIVDFYDHRFNNKLYAGRRRFITQYVEQFPLPDPNGSLAKDIVAMTKRVHVLTPSPDADQLAKELDQMIWKVFGLKVEEVTG